MKLSSLQKGLVGHWTMSQDSLKGSLLADKTPYENDGTIYGATFTTDRKGKANSAMSFDGSSDYVSVPKSVLQTSVSTISFWEFTISGEGYFICDSEGVDNFFMRRRELNVGFVDMKYGGIGWKGGANPFALSYNTWHNHIVTHKSNGDYEWFVDSVSQGITAGSNFAGLTSNLYIGNRQDLQRQFNGSIADVRIYNRVLSQEEITTLYNSYNSKIQL